MREGNVDTVYPDAGLGHRAGQFHRHAANSARYRDIPPWNAARPVVECKRLPNGLLCSESLCVGPSGTGGALTLINLVRREPTAGESHGARQQSLDPNCVDHVDPDAMDGHDDDPESGVTSVANMAMRDAAAKALPHQLSAPSVIRVARIRGGFRILSAALLSMRAVSNRLYGEYWCPMLLLQHFRRLLSS